MPVWPIDPALVDDEYIGTLPFAEAQATFATRGPLGGSARLATCGWHGSDFDPNLGSFAVVQRGGKLDDLLGERIKVTAGPGRAVYAYVIDTLDTLDDLSLTRRCFMALAPPATTALDVLVEVVA
jgi:hypothetical protein